MRSANFNFFLRDISYFIITSDGEYTTNSVTLKPSCQLTYDKTEWKKQNSKRSQEDVLLFYKHPVLKIIDFEIATSQSTSIILLTKIKELTQYYWIKDVKIIYCISRITLTKSDENERYILKRVSIKKYSMNHHLLKNRFPPL